MRTVVSSATKEWVICVDQPFTIVGDAYKSYWAKILAEEMKAGDFPRVERVALAQVAAGATILDVNVGIPLANEPAILAGSIKCVQALVDVPLAIDSSIVAALESGLAVYEGRPLVNSVTGEEERLEAVLPLIKKYDCAVIAISNNETGISEDPDERFKVAKKIVAHAQDYGIKPRGAMASAGTSVMALVRCLCDKLHVNTICGASNCSFGMQLSSSCPSRTG